MTDAFSKTITLELTPAQFARLQELQPDEAKIPQLARELISQSLRANMDRLPGRTTKPQQGRCHDFD